MQQRRVWRRRRRNVGVNGLQLFLDDLIDMNDYIKYINNKEVNVIIIKSGELKYY